MSKTISAEQLSDYLTENIQKIGRIRKEVEEIQVGFNSSFVEWKAKHDAKLERLSEAVLDSWETIGLEVKQKIKTRWDEECSRLEKRREQLREDLIPETQAEADRLLENGQYLTENLRELNPQLNDEMDRIIAKATAYDPDERYATSGDFKKALDWYHKRYLDIVAESI